MLTCQCHVGRPCLCQCFIVWGQLPWSRWFFFFLWLKPILAWDTTNELVTQTHGTDMSSAVIIYENEMMKCYRICRCRVVEILCHFGLLYLRCSCLLSKSLNLFCKNNIRIWGINSITDDYFLEANVNSWYVRGRGTC
jgi:hypothetical protein